MLKKRAVETVEREPWYERPVSSTVGRIQAPITALMLGTMAPFQHTIEGQEPFAKQLVQAAKEDPDIVKHMPLKINYGGVHPIDSLKRVWQNPQTSTVGKLLGTLSLR